MGAMLGRIVGLVVVCFAVLALAGCGGLAKLANSKANAPLAQSAVSKLASIGSSPGAAMMIRIFKESNELEVWKQSQSGAFKLFKSYEICAWSGDLGPKIKEGDRQSPEGFYTITPGLMNPNSNYYLAFNTGFPNKFDRSWGRTGSDLMVHGDCSSRGCYSMTDESIAEIYALARETFKGGNPSLQLQIYPFRMTALNMARHADSPSLSFWKDIKEGYDRTELAQAPPTWDVCEKQYVFGTDASASLDAASACPADAKILPAALAAREAADDATMIKEIAAIADRKAKADAEAKQAADAEAAARARGQAIGSFIGGMFGGAPAIDPNIVPPTPAPRLDRA